MVSSDRRVERRRDEQPGAVGGRDAADGLRRLVVGQRRGDVASGTSDRSCRSDATSAALNSTGGSSDKMM